jgi:hypothetical protein
MNVNLDNINNNNLFIFSVSRFCRSLFLFCFTYYIKKVMTMIESFMFLLALHSIFISLSLSRSVSIFFYSNVGSFTKTVKTTFHRYRFSSSFFLSIWFYLFSYFFYWASIWWLAEKYPQKILKKYSKKYVVFLFVQIFLKNK